MQLSNTTRLALPLSKVERHHAHMNGLYILAVVMALHCAMAFKLLTTTNTVIKNPPTMIEVAMVAQPKPEPIKPQAKERPPAPPVIKPPVKKIVVKAPTPKTIVLPKPVTPPKVVSTVNEQVAITQPTFQSASTFTPAVSAPSATKATSEATHPAENEDSAEGISGGTCSNCSRIETRLQRKYNSRHLTGSISFVFTIDEEGKVINATVRKVEPTEMFDENILATVQENLMEMEFSPKIVNGIAVRFEGHKTIKFQPMN